MKTPLAIAVAPNAAGDSRAATVKKLVDRPKAADQHETAPVRRPRSALTRADFLLIAACVLAFLTIAITRHPLIRMNNGAGPISADFRERTSRAASDSGLVKARIGVARMAGS
jgi:hypothetical protein